MTDEAIALLAPRIGTRAACAAAGVPQATWYRRHRISPPAAEGSPGPARRAGPAAGAGPGRADRRSWTCCTATGSLTWPPTKSGRRCWTRAPTSARCPPIYRVLREAGESRERRAQATHPATVKPELAADGPNQVYSWDITKLHGPAKWTYYHLYVILDIFSRYVVGWMVATCESAVLAEKLIAATCAKQGIGRGQLSIHADRGSSMTSKPVALLLADLGVTQSHSRPARLQRQPVLRSAVQDAEVPAGVPRPVRLDRSRPGALPGLLPLVQQRASSRRARPAHRRRRPLRPGRSRPGRARPGPGRRLSRSPRTLRPQTASPAETARHILDQPAPGQGDRHSVRPA